MKGKPKYKIDNSRLTRLVVKAQNGSERAAEELVNMISGYIHYYSLSLLGDSEKARDAVQDVLLTMLKNLNTLEDPKSFLGWIKTVTANYCRTQLSRGRENLSLDESYYELEDDSDQTSPVKSAETAEVCALVRDAVAQLPLAQRESVMMFYFQQLSIKEISKILEVSENTVKSRLFSARSSMKKRLEKCGAAALASCAVAPLALISFSLISDAESKKGALVPYTAPNGAVKIAAANPVAASSLPVRAAAVGCACLIAVSGIGATAAAGAFKNNAPRPAVEEPYSRPAASSAAANEGMRYTEPVSREVQPETRARQSNAADAQPATTQAARYVQTNSLQNSGADQTQVEATQAVTQTATVQPEVTQPTAAQPAATQAATQPAAAQPQAQRVVYFDAEGWTNFTKVYCHIYEKDGDSFYEWQTNRELCLVYSGSVYVYDLSALSLDENAEYRVIFSADNRAMTNELDFTVQSFGGTARLTGTKLSGFGPSDSQQGTYEAVWSN